MAVECSVVGCTSPIRYVARQLCKRCYQTLRRQNALPPLPARSCANCGIDISGKRAHARFCTDDCRESTTRRDSSQRHRRAVAARKLGKRCGVCGTSIEHRRADALYCGKFCSERSRGLHLLGPSDLRTCALPECGAEFETFLARTRCCSEPHVKRLWNRESRADGRQKNPAWDDRRRNNYHKRRALKAGSAAGGAFANATVFERDGWVCGLCDEPVSRDAVYPDPLSASLDHVVPLSRGGAHSLENVQLAHLACNVRKGAREDFVVSA